VESQRLESPKPLDTDERFQIMDGGYDNFLSQNEPKEGTSGLIIESN